MPASFWTRSALKLSSMATFWLIAFGAVACVLIRRWFQMGDYVTGIDPGNWFAFGRGLFGGVGKSTGGAYPPLVPFLLHLGQTVWMPMTVAKLIGIGSLAVVIAAAYIVATYGMSRWLALVVALVVGLSNPVAEPTAFGGYPQNCAFAGLLITALALALATDRLRTTGSWSRRNLLVAAGALAFTALSHHAYFVIAVLVTGAMWLLFIASRPSKSTALSGTLGFVLAGTPAAILFLPTFLALQRSGYGAPIDAAGTSIEAALRSAIAGAPWLWVPIIATGISYAILNLRLTGRPVARVTVALLMVAAGLLPSGEVRMLPLLMTAAVVSSGLTLNALYARARGTRWTAVPFTVAAAFVVLLFPLADVQTQSSYSFYRVADPSLSAAAAWIDAHRSAGRVVVRQTNRGWPLGWWFEGLSRADIVVGSNNRWLAFPRERERSDLARQLLDERLSVDALRTAAAESGVRYLVLRKWEWIGWQRWTSDRERPVNVAYDDGEYLILDLA